MDEEIDTPGLRGPLQVHSTQSDEGGLWGRGAAGGRLIRRENRWRRTRATAAAVESSREHAAETSAAPGDLGLDPGLCLMLVFVVLR